jgi:acyl-CoA thioesterase-1
MLGIRIRVSKPSHRGRRLANALCAAVVLLIISGCSTPAIFAPTSANAPSPSGPSSKEVLIFGDSYTAGVGADVPTSQGYAYLVSGLTGWTVTVDGVGGTGYVNPGGANHTYQNRITATNYGDRFDMIVMQGSTNDDGREGLSSAVALTVALVKSKYPHALIVLVGPVSFAGTPTVARPSVDSTLRASANAAGVAYISPIAQQWFTLDSRTTLLNQTNFHPNAAGYRVYALKLVGALYEVAPSF